MRFIILFTILFIFTFNAFSQEVSSAAEELAESVKITEKSLQAEKEQLSVKLKLSKTKFKLNGLGKISVELENVGKKPLYIFKNGGWGIHGNLRYFVFDDNCELVLPSYHNPSSPPPPPPLDGFSEKHLTKLKSKQSTTSERWLDISSRIEMPGDYKLTVVFQGIYSEEYFPNHLNVWTREDGQVESNAVSFTVTK